MFLYELALELDVKSTELVEKAAALGFSAGPSTSLTPEQVAALRYEVTGVAPAPSGAFAGPGVAPGAPMPAGAWGSQPAGWPAPGQAPGPYASAPAPGPGGGMSRGQMAAVGGVVAVVLALFGFMVFSTHTPRPRKDDLADSIDSIGADAGAAPTTTATTTTAPAVVAGREPASTAAWLSTPSELSPLLVGRTVAAQWKADPVQVVPADGHTDLGGECIDGHEPTGLATVGIGLRDGSGGLHGQVIETIRSFASPEAATEWVDAHAGTNECTKGLDHEALAADPNVAAIEVESIQDLPAGGGRRAVRYTAGYTSPSGGRCVDYMDSYFEAAGPYGISVTFDTCLQPFDPQAEVKALGPLETRALQASSS